MVTEATCLRAVPVSAEACRASKLALTTAEVSAEPSLKVMPGRSVIVQTSKVELLVIDLAR